MTERNGGIFLDKDGTVVEDIPFNAEANRMRFATGAAEGLRILAALRLPLFVVSNQSGIGLGYFPESALGPVIARLAAMFGEAGATLGGFYYCPHAPQPRDVPNHCACRKPAPGLLLRAAREHAIDLSRSWMIGDILDDVEAGARAGCRTILVDSGNETEWAMSPLRRPDYTVTTLDAAAGLIASAAAVCGSDHQRMCA